MGGDREECIGALQTAVDEIGRPPTVREFEALDVKPSPATVRGVFGSWQSALEAAGVRVDPPLGDDLRSIRQGLGLSQADLADELDVTPMTICN